MFKETVNFKNNNRILQDEETTHQLKIGILFLKFKLLIKVVLQISKILKKNNLWKR